MTADDACRSARQYYETGQLLPARHLYRFALELNPDHALALHGLAQTLARSGSAQEAIAYFRRAIERDPGNAECWSDLGVALKGMNRPAEALEALEEACRLAPTNPRAALLAGALLYEQAEFERAIEYYRQVLRFRPDHADAVNSLATCYKELGSFDEAIACYQQVLQLQPDHVYAYYNLSEFVSEGKYHFTRQNIEDLQAFLSAEHLSAYSRSIAAFALGLVHDAQGDYDQAFRYFEKANALRQSWLKENDLAFDGPQHRAVVDSIVANFDGTYDQRYHEWGSDSELPVFILGMPRSGTTLVEQILASHREVYGAGETDAFARILAEWANLAPSRREKLVLPLPFPDASAARDVAARFLRTLTVLGKGAPRVTLKSSDNVYYLGLLLKLMPRARVIHCRRDPRDVCFSCYIHNFKEMAYSFSFEDIVSYYQDFERLMAHWRGVLAIPIHQVCYEDLLTNQENVTRGLISFCGLNWDERCLAFYHTRRAVQTMSTIQVRKPLSRKPMGRWKHYEAHLAPLFDALKAKGLC